jgi:hypothetical protein
MLLVFIIRTGSVLGDDDLPNDEEDIEDNTYFDDTALRHPSSTPPKSSPQLSTSSLSRPKTSHAYNRPNTMTTARPNTATDVWARRTKGLGDDLRRIDADNEDEDEDEDDEDDIDEGGVEEYDNRRNEIMASQSTRNGNDAYDDEDDDGLEDIYGYRDHSFQHHQNEEGEEEDEDEDSEEEDNSEDDGNDGFIYDDEHLNGDERNDFITRAAAAIDYEEVGEIGRQIIRQLFNIKST